MLDKLDAASRFQQEALDLHAQHQEILAANVADADTPGYQARDLDFASELKKVMIRGREETGGVSLTLAPAQHIPAQTVSVPSMELLYRIPDQPSLSDNTVNMDRERMQFTNNNLRYQMGLTALGGQIKSMMNVLQGGNQFVALLSIFDIVGSALTAQSKRLNVMASNIADVDSTSGPDSQPYRARWVVFQIDAAPGAATDGVKIADIIESQAPDKLIYEPDNPLAGANGYVKMPNVDAVGEMISIMSASHSYQANVEVFNAVKSLMLKTLTLGQ